MNRETAIVTAAAVFATVSLFFVIRRLKGKKRPPPAMAPAKPSPPLAPAPPVAASAAAATAAKPPATAASAGTISPQRASSADRSRPSALAPVPERVEIFTPPPACGVAAVRRQEAVAAVGSDDETASVPPSSIGGEDDDADQTPEGLERRLAKLLGRAKRLHKARNFEAAAAQYTRAMDVLERMPPNPSLQTSLYNNRAAMHEKAGRLPSALSDCSVCLSFDPGHRLARVRKSRIFAALARYEDALAELCALMLGEREKAKAAMAEGRETVMPEAPDNLQEVINQLAVQETDALLAKKAAAPLRNPPGRYSTHEVLMSFQSYPVMLARYKSKSVADASSAVGAAAEAAAAAASGEFAATAAGTLVRSLLERAKCHLVGRDYAEAIVDIDCAAALVLAPPGPAAASAVAAVGEVLSLKETAAASAAGSGGTADWGLVLERAGAAATAATAALDAATTAAAEAAGARASTAPQDENADPAAQAEEPMAVAAEAARVEAEALAAGEVAALRWADPALAGDALQWHGTFLHLRHDLATAKRTYERAVALPGGAVAAHPDIWIKLAGVLMDADDYGGADAYFDRAVAADPNYGTTFMFRAQVHAWRAAVAMAETPQPDVMKAHEEQAAAVADVEKCISLCPSHVNAYQRLVAQHMQAGEQDEALATLDEALRRFPNSSDLLMAKGELLYGQAAAEQEQAAAAAMAGGGDPMAAAMAPATAQRLMGEIAEAQALFDRAMAADPLNPAPMVNQAIARMQFNGDFPGCIQLLEEAIRVDPNFQVGYLHLAQLKMNAADTMAEAEEAIGHFDAAIDRARERSELLEMCLLRAAARGKVRGAQLLQLSSLQ